MAFLLPYPNKALWSNKIHVQIDTVNLNNAIDVQTGCCPIVTQMVEKTNVFNANLQNQLLSDYDLKSQIKLPPTRKH